MKDVDVFVQFFFRPLGQSGVDDYYDVDGVASIKALNESFFPYFEFKSGSISFL